MEEFAVGAIVLMVAIGDSGLTDIGRDAALAMIDFGETNSPHDYAVVLEEFERYLFMCRTLKKIW